jgi:hypothetical protein
LTIADSPHQTRSAGSCDARLAAAVRGGLITLEAASSRYRLNPEELLSWQYYIVWLHVVFGALFFVPAYSVVSFWAQSGTQLIVVEANKLLEVVNSQNNEQKFEWGLFRYIPHNHRGGHLRDVLKNGFGTSIIGEDRLRPKNRGWPYRCLPIVNCHRCNRTAPDDWMISCKILSVIEVGTWT